MSQVINWSGRPLGNGVDYPVRKGCSKYDFTVEQIEQKKEKRTKMVSVSVCLCLCMCVCICECVHACVCACVHACMRAHAQCNVDIFMRGLGSVSSDTCIHVDCLEVK